MNTVNIVIIGSFAEEAALISRVVAVVACGAVEVAVRSTVVTRLREAGGLAATSAGRVPPGDYGTVNMLTVHADVTSRPD